MKKNRTALLMIGIMVELFFLLFLLGKYVNYFTKIGKIFSRPRPTISSTNFQTKKRI